MATATAIDNQNIVFANAGGTLGNLLFVNDRTSTSAGQSLTSIVKAFDTTGNAQMITYSGFTPATGNGAYDFAFDSATQTLAMTDFSNRHLYVFSLAAATIPEPGTLALLSFGTVAMTGVLRRRKK